MVARSDASTAQALSALAHVLFAALLFAALTLPMLQPFGEDDRWLGIGIVMLIVGTATWLPPSLMVPFALAAWVTPFLVWELTNQPSPSQTPFSLEAAAQLAGLLFLGCGASVLYRSVIRAFASRAPRAQSAEPMPQPSPDLLTVATAAEVPRSSYVRTARRLSTQTLRSQDAAVLLERLRRLRFELRETESHLRLGKASR